MRWILYLFGTVFLALGLAVAGTDVMEADGSWHRVGEVWFKWHPSSLQMSESIISRYIDPCGLLVFLDCAPFLWHPGISWLLTSYAAPVFLGLGFALLLAGRWLARR